MTEYKLIINNQLISKEETFDVFNPSDDSLVGRAPKANESDLDNAIEAAKNAYKKWSKTSHQERQQAINAIADLLEEHSDELAKLLTLEQGKPLKGIGSEFELQACIIWARACATLELPVEILEETETTRIEQHRKPLGVVASITPWNWPLAIGSWQILPAILAGNTVVMKPSMFTPLSTLRMAEIICQALPAGVLNVVASSDSGVGKRMTSHPDIAKITFTGSTDTGRKIVSSSANTLKRLTLELGGNDAGIVLPDVSPEKIAEGLFWSAFINNGQTCAALKRLYVHESIYDEVCDQLVAYAKTVPVGDGMDESNLLGPVQNTEQFEKICELVESAKQAGGRILCGGQAPSGKGYFYPITLVADIDDSCPLVNQEQFGPVLPIIKYTDIEDALSAANANENGLGGSIWSADIERASTLAGRLECGTAWVNKHAEIRPDIPFGGAKTSGCGVSFGKLGLEEFTQLQVISV